MTKDTATIREVYQAISEMRKEMQDMRKELKEDTKTSLDAHCKWAEDVVKDAYKVADDYKERIEKVESWQSTVNGKMAVIGSLVMFAMSIVSALIVSAVKQVFEKG